MPNRDSPVQNHLWLPGPRGSKSGILKIQAGLLASGSWLPTPSHLLGSGFVWALLSGYSGGPATDFHRLPYWTSKRGDLNLNIFDLKLRYNMAILQNDRSLSFIC